MKRSITQLLLALSLVSATTTIGLSQDGGKTDSPAASQNGAPQAAPQAAPPSDFPDLTIPEKADAAALQSIVAKAKQARPTNGEQYKAQQTAIKTASAKLMQMLKKDSSGYQQAEVDSITASVSLLTFFNEKDQATLITQLTDFLKGRKQLSMQDVQTGMMAAGMLELQPQKQPAHSVYSVLDELLKPDKRPEMQSLRLHIQASIRRLEMLGRKFEFEAKSIDGKSLKTDDFAGKYVLVSFFASWSKPSIAELSLVKTHYEKYAAKGLVVVGVCMDENRTDLDNILKQTPLPWPVVHDNAANVLDRFQLKYGIASLPTGLLLNKEGTVISLEARNDELTRLMQMLFDAPTPAAAPDPNKTTSSASNDAAKPKQ